jgi:hypothetical protein
VKAMKKLMALGLAMFLGACAANADDGASEQANSGAAAATANAAGPTIAQCNNRKACVDSVVLRAVLSSDLRLNRQPDQILQSTLAREAVAEWLAKSNDGRLEITVTRGAGGNSEVLFSMIAGHETKEDEGDIMAMNFTFTMDATNRIIENIVDTELAG